ncbi:MAG: carbon storage regulator [Planctomycetota bacterium]
MLILSRREAESICLGDDIELTIVAVGNDKVRIGVKAPPEVRILRNELEVQEHTIPFPGRSDVPATEATEERPVAPLSVFRKAA